jgi:hypothetical protein
VDPYLATIPGLLYPVRPPKMTFDVGANASNSECFCQRFPSADLSRHAVTRFGLTSGLLVIQK